ncbi:MAG: hypothetical protein MUC29_02560 [Pyrinomonadaceae bacterium]|nr:hypothetical protein [Pyrinomonadaceae bacterium]
MLVLLHLFALFILVLLGFYVFVASPRSRANQTFATFISFLALWTIKDITLWNFHQADETASWWASASFIIALMMQSSLVVFAWVFPENLRTPRKKAAIIFAPSGSLVPAALRAVAKGGVVVCAGIHMSEIPAFSYDLLWGERVLRSVANLTRQDGEAFLALAPKIPIQTQVQAFPLIQANEALQALRNGQIQGAAVLEINP